jgi:hypothetical protein
MLFKQTNNNAGDVNNAISEKGSVVQTTGADNRVQVDHLKEGVWAALWKKVKACWKWLFG